MVNFQRYPKYKDSGVKWIGEIPEEWNIDRIKKSVTNLKNGIWGEEPQGDENDVFCIRVADFNRNNFEVEDRDFTVRNLDKVKQKAYMLKKDDLLIEKSGGGEKQPVGFVVRYNLDKPAIYANFMAKIELNKEIAYPNYFKYLYSSMYSHRINVRSIKQTTGIQNLDTSYYFQEIVPYPSIKEQKQIADFLDQKTSEIDSLIANKEKLIELLEEKRQVIITEAITKGLNPNVKMKDSGVEWIGEIPEGWGVSKIKYQADINKYTLSENTDEDLEIKYIDISSVNSRGEVVNIEKYYFKDAPSRARRILRKGDTIVSTVRTYLKAITWFEEVEENLICSTGFAVLSPKETIYPKYLFYLMRSTKYIDEIVKRSIGVSYPAITSTEIGMLECLLPNINEQKMIVEHIDNELKKIDGLVDEIKLQIQKLKEYRQSLIYEAVTGKIDVRDYVRV